MSANEKPPAWVPALWKAGEILDASRKANAETQGLVVSIAAQGRELAADWLAIAAGLDALTSRLRDLDADDELLADYLVGLVAHWRDYASVSHERFEQLARPLPELFEWQREALEGLAATMRKADGALAIKSAKDTHEHIDNVAQVIGKSHEIQARLFESFKAAVASLEERS